MWNKLASLFILGLLIGALWFWYYYFFVLNKWSLILEGNIWEYRVELFNQELKTTFATECQDARCELIDLAPFQYQMRIIKEDYEWITQNIQIEKKTQKVISFELKKEILIIPTASSSINSQQRIAQIQQNNFLKQQYKFFDLWEKWFFYIEKNPDETLTLIDLNTKTSWYSFEQIPPKDISLFEVAWDESVVLSIEKKYVLIDYFSGNVEVLEFAQDLNYVKKDGNIFSFVNEKWVFLYDITKKTFQYFYLFKDFIYLDENHYVGIVFSDESQKKQNLNLQDISGNILLKYNHKTQQKEVIHTTQMNISKILHLKWEVFLVDTSNNFFKIENIK